MSQEELSRASRVRIYEYSKAAAVELHTQPAAVFPSSLHEEDGPSRVVPLDLSTSLNTTYKSTSPNLLASFIKINVDDPLFTSARATSQLFYVLRGKGSTTSEEHGCISWKKGDLFVLPATKGALSHVACSESEGDKNDAALYWLNDEPLLKYLGVSASEERFGAAFYSNEVLLSAVEAVRHEEGAEHRNRMGVLLSNENCPETKTLTPTLWALLNVLPANTKQPPHRHQSVAIDLAVNIAKGAEGKVYTMMGPELNEDGWVKNPIKMDWATNAVFTTPPGWWHSHHNESNEDAWVLPTQDAGLYTHQRTLDIRFSHAKPMPAGSGGK
jgi:gentisate 1,2-dioxygenase